MDRERKREREREREREIERERWRKNKTQERDLTVNDTAFMLRVINTADECGTCTRSCFLLLLFRFASSSGAASSPASPRVFYLRTDSTNSKERAERMATLCAPLLAWYSRRFTRRVACVRAAASVYSIQSQLLATGRWEQEDEEGIRLKLVLR